MSEREIIAYALIAFLVTGIALAAWRVHYTSHRPTVRRQHQADARRSAERAQVRQGGPAAP